MNKILQLFVGIMEDSDKGRYSRIGLLSGAILTYNLAYSQDIVLSTILSLSSFCIFYLLEFFIYKKIPGASP